VQVLRTPRPARTGPLPRSRRLSMTTWTCSLRRPPVSGTPKTEHRRALRQRLSANRTNSAIEYKHQNISAVMIELGLPYIRGYTPMGNRQEALAIEIQRRLQADPALLSRLQSKPTDALPASPLQRTEPPQRAAGNRERASAGNRPGRHPDYGLLQATTSAPGYEDTAAATSRTASAGPPVTTATASAMTSSPTPSTGMSVTSKSRPLPLAP